MSSLTDPIRTWRRRRAIAGSAGAVAAGIAFVWAIVPIRIPDAANSEGFAREGESASTPGVVAPEPPFDAAVFQVRLWNAPVAPGEALAANSEPPAPPPNLELIAIITESQRYLAALYEIGADRLHIAGAGDRIGRLEILQVDSGGVDLRDGSRSFRLSISPPPSGSETHLTLGASEEVHP